MLEKWQSIYTDVIKKEKVSDIYEEEEESPSAAESGRTDLLKENLHVGTTGDLITKECLNLLDCMDLKQQVT